MNLYPFFKGMVDEDRCAVVVCSCEHEIIYMNPAAIGRYAKWGGEALVGKSLLECHNAASGKRIKEAVAWFLESRSHSRMYTYHNEKENKDVYMVALRDADGNLIGYYEKHEYRDRETAAPYQGV